MNPNGAPVDLSIKFILNRQFTLKLLEELKTYLVLIDTLVNSIVAKETLAKCICLDSEMFLKAWDHPKSEDTRMIIPFGE